MCVSYKFFKTLPLVNVCHARFAKYKFNKLIERILVFTFSKAFDTSHRALESLHSTEHSTISRTVIEFVSKLLLQSMHIFKIFNYQIWHFSDLDLDPPVKSSTWADEFPPLVWCLITGSAQLPENRHKTTNHRTRGSQTAHQMPYILIRVISCRA